MRRILKRIQKNNKEQSFKRANSDRKEFMALLALTLQTICKKKMENLRRANSCRKYVKEEDKNFSSTRMCGAI